MEVAHYRPSVWPTRSASSSAWPIRLEVCQRRPWLRHTPLGVLRLLRHFFGVPPSRRCAGLHLVILLHLHPVLLLDVAAGSVAHIVLGEQAASTFVLVSGGANDVYVVAPLSGDSGWSVLLIEAAGHPSFQIAVLSAFLGALIVAPQPRWIVVPSLSIRGKGYRVLLIEAAWYPTVFPDL